MTISGKLRKLLFRVLCWCGVVWLVCFLVVTFWGNDEAVVGQYSAAGVAVDLSGWFLVVLSVVLVGGGLVFILDQAGRAGGGEREWMKEMLRHLGS